ncbi:hypothetical protein AB8O53_28325, partial [Streptomyces pilosus]
RAARGGRRVTKPHPLTGSVDPRAGAADRRIRELIHAANRSRPGRVAEPSAELARLTAELDRLTTSGFRAGADQVERMLAQSAPEPGRAEAVTRLTAAWEAAYWASLPDGEHQVVTEARPSLYACFNEADLLISDVSSVITDFLAGGKPYAVANTGDLSEPEFRAAFPTVAAATVLTPDASGVPALLDAVRHPERDGLREARAELKQRLLGPAVPPAQERFAAAVGALCAAAREHRARVSDRHATELPGQRRETAGAASGGAALTPQRPSRRA